MKFTWLLLVGAAALANAGPVARDACAAICDTAQTKLFFEPGKTYVYDYEGETLTTIEGAMEEVSGLHVKTTARIHAMSPCEMQLELAGTELSHMTPNNVTEKTASPVGGAFKNALEANAIRFGINNGKVEQVCGGVKDAAWILNIKKAIVSALQNNMADLKAEATIRETDVVGTCDTVYTPAADGSIVKTKNLLGCINREHMNTMVQHAHYMVPSGVQGVPFLKSEHTCKQVIAEGKITKVTCTESHIARAFSNGEAGAATHLRMKMTFKEAVAENKAPMPIAFTSPITFDMTKTEREIKDAAAFIKAALTEVCTAGHVEDKSAERFAKMIKNVKALDAVTLTKIHQEMKAAKTCRLGEKTLHDVLPLAGTTAAVSLMKDILLAGEITGVEKDMWKSALAFIPNPNKEMIAHVTPLLATPDHKIYLSTSTMIRNFCAERTDCDSIKEVQDFIKVLEARIGNDCSGSEDEVLMSLKAIGNAGVTLTGKTTLIKCIKNEKTSMDLKLASLEAFRHMELGSAKPALLELYKNMDLDPEIRIGAFVALMRDPCKMCIDAVQATMAKERVLQVGSFVMSFMENARRSENPAMKEVNTVLKTFDETKIKRDWNLERMKYSRAYEASYFSSYLNAGIDAESQVIFSQAGFLPRQIKTDLNINLFGRSINLFEMGARMEGLESVLEYYFGDKGPLTETGVGRTKRAALDTDSMTKIDDKVKARSPLKDASGLMYLKMFGSELGYTRFDLETILKKKDGINVLELLKSIAQNHEQEYTQNFQVMDMAYTIPTVLGLPLKLDLNAHGTMHLKVGGKIDIVKLMQPPRNLDIDGHIKPSAAIEVKTEMGIDAFLTHTGIKMVANLHTSTAIEGKIMLKDGKIFKVHYAVPETEQEIFHGMTKFFVKHHNTEREQRMITQDAIAVDKCTGETLAKVTGLEMCGEIRLPNAAMVKTAPYFPLTGPVNMRLAILKRDPKLTSYDFEASRTSADGVEALKLILDTPKSEINRELSTIVTLNTAAKNLAIDIKSPWKKVAASASLVNNEGLKKLFGKVVVDEKREYSATATVLIQKEKDTMKIIPEFNVNMNGVIPVTVGGSITYEKNARVVYDLKIEKLTETPITFVGTMGQVLGDSQLRFNHDLTFTSPLVTLASKGFVERKAVKVAIRSENMFKFRDGKEHKMVFDSKLHLEKKRDVKIMNLNSNLALSDFPEHNMGIAVELKKTAIHTKFNVEATFKKDVQPIKFLNDWTLKLTSPLDVALKSELVLPIAALSMEHKLTQTAPKEFKLLSLTKWAETKEAKAEFTLTVADAEVMSAELKGYLVTPVMPRVDLLIKPTITKTMIDLAAEIKYENCTHGFVLTGKKEGNLVTIHSHIMLDANKYEFNLKGRAMTNLLEINADAKWRDQVFAINWSAAIQKSAIKVHTDITAMGTKAEFNLNGEMTGEAIKAHIDAALAEKKIEAVLEYFRKDWNLRVLANVNGLTHLNSKIGSVALKIHNELAVGEGGNLTTLVEAKADEKEILVVALKGSLTPDAITGNAKITALTTTLGGDFMLTALGGYTAIVNVELPERIVGVEAKFGGSWDHGVASLLINTNKKVEDNTFEYALKWSTAAPKDRQQFMGEFVIKSPAKLFPLPIKMTALISRDILGTYKTDLAIDYGFKFEFKGIHKCLPIGYQTNVEINTPIEGHEKMTGELIATLAENVLNFKLAAAHNKKAIEVILTGKASDTQQEIDFSFKAPIKGLEMITASIKNKIAGLNVDASAELKWGLNKKVAVVFSNKASSMENIKGKLAIVTPIETFELTTLEYGFETKGTTRNLLIKLTLARDQIIELASELTAAGLNVHASAELKWGVNKKVAIIISNTGSDVHDTTGKLTVVIPIETYNTTTLEYGFKQTKETTNLLWKITWANEQIIELTAVHTLKPDMKLGFVFETVLKAPTIEDLKLNIDFSFKPMKLIDMHMTGMFGEKTIALIAKASKTDTKIDAAIVVKTPKNPEGISAVFAFVNPNQGTNMDTSLTLTLEPTKVIKFTAYIKKENWNHAAGKMELTSFLTDKVAAEFGWNVSEKEGIVKTNLVIEYVPGKKITFDFDLLHKGTDLALTVMTTTPIDPLRLIKYSVKSTGGLDNLNTHVEGQFNDMIISTDFIAKLTSLKDFDITLTTTAPIRNFEKTSFAIIFKEAATLTAKATLLLKGETWGLELVSRHMELNNIESTLTVTTPLTNWEKTALLVSNKGTTPTDWLTKVSLLLNEKTWAVEYTTHFSGVTDMSLGITITTPLKNLETITLNLSHKGGLNEMVTKIMLVTPTMPVEIEFAAKFLKITDMQAKLTLKGLTTLPIMIQTSNRGENLKPLLTIVSVSLGPDVYSLTSTLNFEAITNMEGSLIATTPIEKYERVGLTWTNKIAAGKKEAKLVVEFQTEQRIVLEGHILAKDTKLETRLTMTTPFAAFDKAAFALDFTGVPNNFELMVSIALPKLRTTEVHFTHMLDLSNGIVHKTSFRIDCIFFSTTSLATELELKAATFKFTSKFGYGLKKGTYTLVAKITETDGMKFELETTLNTDWTEAKSAAFTLGLAKNPTQISIATTFKYNDVDLLSLTYTHIPLATGWKCTLALKQKIVPEIHEAWNCNLDVDATLGKSMIQITALTNGTTLASLEFGHTYETTKLTAKLALTFQTMKAETNMLITKPIETILIKFDASKDEKKIVDFAASYGLTTDKTHALKVKAVYEGKTLIDVVFKFKPVMEDAVVVVEESGRNLLGLTGNLIGQKLEAHIIWHDAPLIDLVTEFHLKPITIAAELKFKGATLFVTKNVFEMTKNAIEIHINWQNAPLVDLKADFTLAPYTLAVELKYKGDMIFTTRNIVDLKDNSIVIHITWQNAPLIDLKAEFKPTPYTIAIELKYKGKMMLTTRNILDIKENSIEIHINWQNTPLIDLKAEFKTAPYTLAVELKYEGKMMLTTRNILDLKAKTISAMLNIDPLLELFIVKPESWVLVLEGNVAKRRDLTICTVDLKKADKIIHLELTTKTATKMDWQNINAVADLKITTKNFAKEWDISFVTEVKRNAGYVKTSVITIINQAEYLRHLFEFKSTAVGKHEATTTLFILPLAINTEISAALAMTDIIDYKLAVIGNKATENDTTIVISGAFTTKPENLLFDIKMVLPTRTMVLTIKNVFANKNLNHLVSFSWEAGKTTGYSFTLADRSKEDAMIFNIVGEFTHPIRTVKYTGKAEISARKYLIALDVLPDATLPERKTFFKIDVANESNGEMINLKTEATFGHPSLEKPLTLSVTLTLNRGKVLAASIITLDFSKMERKRISFSFRVVKESRNAKNIHYTLVSEVKQPANFVDVRINADIKRTAAGMIEHTTRVSYLTSERETKTVAFNIVANLADKMIAVRATTPTADRKVIVSLLEKLTAEGRHVRLAITHEDILAKIVTPILDIELDEPSQAFRVEITDLLKMDAGIHEKYMVRFSIIAKGRKTLLLKTSFKDATHMLINTRLEWDPVLIETIKTEVPPLVAKATGYLAATFEPIVKVILEDIQTKLDALNKVGLKDLKPLFEAWKKFVRALDKDLSTAIKGLKQMWRQNEFYLKDLEEVLTKSWEKFMTTYSAVEARFLFHYQDVIAYLEKNHKELITTLRSLEAEVRTHAQWLRTEFLKIKAQIEADYETLRPRVEAAVLTQISIAENMTREFIAEYEPKVKAFVAETMKTIGTVRDTIEPLIAQAKAQIAAWKVEMNAIIEPLRVKAIALWAEFVAKMEEIKTTGLAKALIELQKDLEAKYATTSAAVVEWLREMNAKLEAAVKEWEAYPQVVELKKSIDIFTEKLVWAWKYLDIEGEVTRLVEDMAMRRNRFWRIIQDNKSGVIVYDTAAGILEFDVEIPIALKELARIPTFDTLTSRFDVARREVLANAPKLGWTPMDYYHYWMPKTTGLPPFTATAMVAGNQHFFTFDGSFMEFAGDCSYVLARDFADGKFTVIANYRRTRAGPKRQSISVMAGPNTVEVFNTFKTVVDKDIVELPIDLPEASIKRAGVDQITIESKKGMTVSCHMKTEICTVAISGWYFGKTGGLLGTYDYEPSTDMTNPMGKRLEDIERFANTWEVAKTCSDKTNYAKAFHKVANIKTTPAYTVCADLFLAESSALRPAFRVLDATPFMNMCINDVFEWQNHPEADKMMTKKACTAVAAYMEEAKLRGIMMEAPKACMSCTSVEGQEMSVGAVEKVTKAMEGVDTVVIVEENICNKNKRKDLLGLISTLQKAYNKEGLKDNLFGLAAFGGPGVHKEPHFHTIEGEVMNTDRKFVRGVRGLEFAEETPLNFVEGAIAFAAKNYPWRAGFQRNIIVVSCSRCMDRQPPHTDLRAVITETKVVVHMLRDLELAFRGGKRAASVLGFDKTGVFTTKATSATNLEGDAALLAQLAVPKEHCLPALMDLEGTFFSINSWTAGRVREQKKLVEVVSRRVAASSQPETCQICECKVVCPFTMKTTTICKPCKK